MGIRLHKIEKILIIQTAFIGDVVLVSPLIRASNDLLPPASIDALVIPSAANSLEKNPALHRLILYDKRGRDAGVRSLLALAGRLRRERYDLVLVPHRSLRSAFLAWWTRAALRVGFTTSSAAFLFTHRVVYNRKRHEVERNLALLGALGQEPGLVPPEIFPDEADHLAVDRMLASLGGTTGALIAIAPGSIWATKRWPAESYRRLAEMVLASGWRLVWIGSRGDRTLCTEISDGLSGFWVNSAGELSLRQSAELIGRAEVLVSNDSAPLHLASAMGTAAVALFGPTIPEFGFGPLSAGSVIVQIELPCRPCSIHGGNSCPIGTHKCMTGIPPEMVFAELSNLIKRKSKHERNHQN